MRDDDRLRSRVDAMAAITTVELLTDTPALRHPSVGASYVVLPDVGAQPYDEAVVVDVPRIPAPSENRGWVPVDLGTEYEPAREFMIVIQDEAGLRWCVAAHREDIGEEGESAPTYALHVVSDRGACFTGYIGRENDGSWHPEASAFCRWSPVIPPMLRGADEAAARIFVLRCRVRFGLAGRGPRGGGAGRG
ncbi:hypothetical protein BSZ39_00135 [Bowdeniella nasicola]|uniref:Uncharacterized protein n=1 Tax=Bowdeniella nasicola TaxID=208480 RepID=A0A1Q5Q627_9ACTO|nr:hypothetical protein [Bowdeniella nasicola]OKL55149.1 hypothetical protein BSZ39_00135 [Bowdeniella nasicola]